VASLGSTGEKLKLKLTHSLGIACLEAAEGGVEGAQTSYSGSRL
jgi:hypothetical protein